MDPTVDGQSLEYTHRTLMSYVNIRKIEEAVGGGGGVLSKNVLKVLLGFHAATCSLIFAFTY